MFTLLSQKAICTTTQCMYLVSAVTQVCLTNSDRRSVNLVNLNNELKWFKNGFLEVQLAENISHSF